MEIDAMRFDGTNESAMDILKWAGTPPVAALISPATGECYALSVGTAGGIERVNPGGWIINHGSGYWTATEEHFNKFYEIVEEP